MLSISAAAWIALAAAPGCIGLHLHHRMPGMTPPWAPLAAGWALMLAAMMAPGLAGPVRHVFDRSFARRRARAIALFAAGYGAMWMAAGMVLLAAAWAGRAAVSDADLLAGATALLALVWQFSPWKQRCLNRGHLHPEMAAFGRAADWDALRFGMTHGIWCAGSCWALMLLPLMMPIRHMAGMAGVTLWLFGERLERPVAPHWRLRFPAKAARIAVAQARWRLQLG